MGGDLGGVKYFVFLLGGGIRKVCWGGPFSELFSDEGEG